MTRYRNRREPYKRDLYRYSIYPRIPKPQEASAPGSLRHGDVVEVEVTDIDEKGRGVAKYHGKKIHIYGGATVGDKIKVRIDKVFQDEAIGRVVEWIGEDKK